MDGIYLFIPKDYHLTQWEGRNVNIKLLFKVRAQHVLSFLSFHFSAQHLFLFNIAKLLSGIVRVKNSPWTPNFEYEVGCPVSMANKVTKQVPVHMADVLLQLGISILL